VRWGKTKSLIGAQGLCDGINMVEPRARPCAAIKYNVKLYNLSNSCRMVLVSVFVRAPPYDVHEPDELLSVGSCG
jgi:hypothetical protein